MQRLILSSNDLKKAATDSWLEISKEIRDSTQGVSGSDYLAMDLNLIDKKLNNYFLLNLNNFNPKEFFSESYFKKELEIREFELNNIQKLIEKIKEFKGLHQNCKDRIVEFEKTLNNYHFQFLQALKSSTRNLMSNLPREIIENISFYLNSRDQLSFWATASSFYKIGSFPYSYFNKSTSFPYLTQEHKINLSNPESLLYILTNKIPVQEILNFTKRYFRPVSCPLYVKLQKFANEKPINFPALLCYALLTDDITLLDPEQLKELYQWLLKPENKSYASFSKSILGILAVLNEDADQFQEACIKDKKPALVMGRENNTENNIYYFNVKQFPWEVMDNTCDYFKFVNTCYYFNFANATFSNKLFPPDTLFHESLYYVDLRVANLEKTKWTWGNDKLPLASTNERLLTADKWPLISMVGANLENAIMRYFPLKEVNLSFANCTNMHFINCNFFLEPCEMKNANFTGAHFENINPHVDLGTYFFNNYYHSVDHGLYFKEANLTDATFIKINEEETPDSLAIQLENLRQMMERTFNAPSERYYKNEEDVLLEKTNILRVAAKNIVEGISNFDSNRQINLLKCASSHPLFSICKGEIDKIFSPVLQSFEIESLPEFRYKR